MRFFNLLLLTSVISVGTVASGCISTKKSEFQVAGPGTFHEQGKKKTAEEEHKILEQTNKLFAAGLKAEQQGDLRSAQWAYLNCLNVKDSQRYLGPPYHRLAVLAARTGDYEKSEAYYRKACEFGTQNPQLLCDYAQMLYDNDRPREAETVLANALIAFPKNKRLQFFLGHVVASQDRPVEAHRHMKESVGEAQAYREIAEIMRRQGKNHEADLFDQKQLLARKRQTPPRDRMQEEISLELAGLGDSDLELHVYASLTPKLGSLDLRYDELTRSEREMTKIHEEARLALAPATLSPKEVMRKYGPTVGKPAMVPSGIPPVAGSAMAQPKFTDLSPRPVFETSRAIAVPPQPYVRSESTPQREPHGNRVGVSLRDEKDSLMRQTVESESAPVESTATESATAKSPAIAPVPQVGITKNSRQNRAAAGIPFRSGDSESSDAGALSELIPPGHHEKEVRQDGVIEKETPQNTRVAQAAEFDNPEKRGKHGEVRFKPLESESEHGVAEHGAAAENLWSPGVNTSAAEIGDSGAEPAIPEEQNPQSVVSTVAWRENRQKSRTLEEFFAELGHSVSTPAKEAKEEEGKFYVSPVPETFRTKESDVVEDVVESAPKREISEAPSQPARETVKMQSSTSVKMGPLAADPKETPPRRSELATRNAVPPSRAFVEIRNSKTATFLVPELQEKTTLTVRDVKDVKQLGDSSKQTQETLVPTMTLNFEDGKSEPSVALTDKPAAVRKRSRQRIDLLAVTPRMARNTSKPGTDSTAKSFSFTENKTISYTKRKEPLPPKRLARRFSEHSASIQWGDSREVSRSGYLDAQAASRPVLQVSETQSSPPAATEAADLSGIADRGERHAVIRTGPTLMLHRRAECPSNNEEPNRERRGTVHDPRCQ